MSTLPPERVGLRSCVSRPRALERAYEQDDWGDARRRAFTAGPEHGGAPRAREAAATPGRSYTEPWRPVPDSGQTRRATVARARAGARVCSRGPGSCELLGGSQRVKHSTRSRGRWGVLTSQLLAPILRSNGQRQHQQQSSRPASKAMGENFFRVASHARPAVKVARPKQKHNPTVKESLLLALPRLSPFLFKKGPRSVAPTVRSGIRTS